MGLDRRHHRYSSGSDSLQSTNSFTSFINVINLIFLLREVKTFFNPKDLSYLYFIFTLMTWLLFVLINQVKYYAQDTGNQYSILGRLLASIITGQFLNKLCNIVTFLFLSNHMIYLLFFIKMLF
jgi:hypothetical protein